MFRIKSRHTPNLNLICLISKRSIMKTLFENQITAHKYKINSHRYIQGTIRDKEKISSHLHIQCMKITPASAHQRSARYECVEDITSSSLAECVQSSIPIHLNKHLNQYDKPRDPYPWTFLIWLKNLLKFHDIRKLGLII